MAETFTFDPTDEATGTQLQIVPSTSTSYALVSHRYPTPPLETQWAASVDTEGDRPASSRYRNREIPMEWEVFGTTAANAHTALVALQMKIAKLAREGGTFRRVLETGESFTFDVLTVSDWEPIFDIAYYLGNTITVTFTLVCKPFARGAEVDLGDNTATTTPWLVFTEAGVTGDVPALGRLVIDNDSVRSKYGVLWGIRSRHYSAGSPLVYETGANVHIATSLSADATAYSGNASVNTSLTTGFASQLYVGLDTGNGHIGTFRVYARLKPASGNAGVVSVRLGWEQEYGANPFYNDTVVLPSGADDGSWVLVDLGLVTIPKARTGSQLWRGYMEAKSSSAGDDLSHNYFLLVPCDEGYGIAESGASSMAATPANAQSVQVRWDGILVGTGSSRWRRPYTYSGDLLVVPPASTEARTVEIVVKLNEFPFGDTIAGATYTDPVAKDSYFDDDLSARLYITPRYLTVA